MYSKDPFKTLDVKYIYIVVDIQTKSNDMF